MLWILFATVLIGAAVFTAWKFGLFDKFEMEKGRLMACEILYLPYTGEYSKIGPLFEEVTKDTKSVFKFSENFGFYYDNPAVTAPQNCRAIVGIMVNEGEEFKIRQFLSQHPGYKQSYLKTTKYLSYEMPYVNILSILLMIKSIYPKIHEYIKREEIDDSNLSGMMEVYKCVRADKKIQIILPLEGNNQFLALIQRKQSHQQERIEEKADEPRVSFVEENQMEMMREQ